MTASLWNPLRPTPQDRSRLCCSAALFGVGLLLIAFGNTQPLIAFRTLASMEVIDANTIMAITGMGYIPLLIGYGIVLAGAAVAAWTGQTPAPSKAATGEAPRRLFAKEHHRWFFVSGMPGSPLDNVLGRLVWSCFVWRCPGRTCGSGRRRSRSIAVHLPVSLWTVWFRARLSVIIDRAGKRLQWRTGDPTEAKLLMATNVHEHAGAAFWLLNTPNPYPAIFRPDASGNQVSSHQYFPASQFSRLQTFP